MAGEDVTDLLQRLSSPAADAAWSDFLALYSPLIMRVVRRFESDGGRAADCYVDVCASLSDERFRRLRSFRADGTARFDTWLKTVVSNLCVDWRRRQHGRFRPVRALQGLPDLERRVFHCMYAKGMPRAECLHVLQARFPDLTDLQLSEINARLFSLLTPGQRWQAGVRAAPRVSLDASLAPDEGPPELQVAEPGPGPDGHAEADEERRLVAAAMQRLPSRQRLLLRMRYEQNLSLAEIARLTGLPDTNRVYRELEAAVAAVRKLVDP